MIEHWTLRAAASAAPLDRGERLALGERVRACSARLRAARALFAEGALAPAAVELSFVREELASIRAQSASLAALAVELDDPGDPAAPWTGARERALGASIERADRALESLMHASRSRVGRALTLLVRYAVVVLCATLAFGLSRDFTVKIRRPNYTVRTSGRWNSEYSSFFAADGDRRTNWLLPDASFGWVELGFSPRVVRTVKLYNVWQMYWYAAHAVAVEPMRNGASLGVHELDISRTIGRGDPFVFSLPTAVEADAVRVHVRSYDGYGGGLAEVEVQ